MIVLGIVIGYSLTRIFLITSYGIVVVVVVVLPLVFLGLAARFSAMRCEPVVLDPKLVTVIDLLHLKGDSRGAGQTLCSWWLAERCEDCLRRTCALRQNERMFDGGGRRNFRGGERQLGYFSSCSRTRQVRHQFRLARMATDLRSNSMEFYWCLP